MRLTTWNVLHRIHAVNWNEAPAAAYPDERDRTRKIAEIVAGWLADGVDAVCLQEVSGDQLAALRAHVAPSVAVLAHRLPRVPRVRGPGAAELVEPGEHLVVLAREGALAKVREAHTFESDPGKGRLVVDVAGDAVVICTHVSYGERSPAQLASVAAAAATTERAVVVVAGDFNAPADEVTRSLGEGFVLARLAGATRIVPGGASKAIDHVLVRGAHVTSATVLATGDLSDHVPVAAELALPPTA